MEQKRNIMMITRELYHEDPQESEEYDDSLSLCNLSIKEEDHNKLQEISPRNSSAEEFFEFFTSSEMNPTSYTARPDIVFCGKIFHEEEENNNQLDDQNRDSSNNTYLSMNKFHRSGSGRVLNSQKSANYSGSSNYYNQIQNVNITSLTSMSAKSRRRMFMFGPVKFKPEMDLSAIKERQGRRVPTAMFPAPDGDRKISTGVSGGDRNIRSGKSHWPGIMRSLRCRSNFSSVLAKSLGCIAPGVGVEKLMINMAN
ncbi:hypothetical protein M9H77_34680 [Catharanthus roseus]|uniref:Uncharacterized protein n=1 Tax=Catharanthus roseus TaxID=4058 RepID=A0ACB9ZML4_CATRO|nr:hypothetical protein M9H77_34680 [Catharanthus roseus]